MIGYFKSNALYTTTEKSLTIRKNFIQINASSVCGFEASFV